MNFNAPNYEEHLQEYFHQKLFSSKIFLYFLYVKNILCPQTYLNDVISISFKINSEKSLGKAFSFTQIYGILKNFPDFTLHMENMFGTNYGSNTLICFEVITVNIFIEYIFHLHITGNLINHIYLKIPGETGYV